MQNKKIGPTVAKYYCLWLAQLMLSFVCVWAACTGLHMDDMLAKLLVDALLAVASYQVQLRWVFSEKTPRPVLYGSGEAMAAKRTNRTGSFRAAKRRARFCAANPKGGAGNRPARFRRRRNGGRMKPDKRRPAPCGTNVRAAGGARLPGHADGNRREMQE